MAFRYRDDLHLTCGIKAVEGCGHRTERNRKLADDVFRAAMIAAKTGRFRHAVEYRAIRWFGWCAFYLSSSPGTVLFRTLARASCANRVVHRWKHHQQLARISHQGHGLRRAPPPGRDSPGRPRRRSIRQERAEKRSGDYG